MRFFEKVKISFKHRTSPYNGLAPALVFKGLPRTGEKTQGVTLQKSRPKNRAFFCGFSSYGRWRTRVFRK